jgi:hypothetical protein
MVGGKSCRAFVKELTDAGRTDLVEWLATANQTRMETPPPKDFMTLSPPERAGTAIPR